MTIMTFNIKDIEKYMLINENIISYKNFNNLECIKNDTEMLKNNSKNLNNSKKTNNSNNKIDSDKLFWSLYIIIFGDIKYELDNSFKVEKEFKIECIEKLRKIKSELKAIKIRLNEVENNLLNEKYISIKSVIALTILHKLNLFYIWDSKYYEIINDSESNINCIIKDNDNYKLNLDLNEKDRDFYKNNFFNVENIEKPLKAITAYTKDELIDFCKKLQINDIGNKSTKKSLYELILPKIR